MQLGLAGAVAADGMMSCRPNHFGCQNQRVALIGGTVVTTSAPSTLAPSMAAHDVQSLESEAREDCAPASELLWIRVIQTQLTNAHM